MGPTSAFLKRTRQRDRPQKDASLNPFDIEIAATNTGETREENYQVGDSSRHRHDAIGIELQKSFSNNDSSDSRRKMGLFSFTKRSSRRRSATSTNNGKDASPKASTTPRTIPPSPPSDDEQVESQVDYDDQSSVYTSNDKDQSSLGHLNVDSQALQQEQQSSDIVIPNNASNDPDHHQSSHTDKQSILFWRYRMKRREIYSRHYRPNRKEAQEMQHLEQYLGISQAKASHKNVIVTQWMRLTPSESQAANQQSPVSILLKRGSVTWSDHDDCELIFLTRGFVVARKLFQFIPRFQFGDVWTEVKRVFPTSPTSFALACGPLRTLEFQCRSVVEQQAWMEALTIVVLEAYTHSNSFPDECELREGWQYRVIQTPWFTEAVTGQVLLDTTLLDQMDPQKIDTVDGYLGFAPLHYATRANHVDAMRFLLQAGADVNVHDRTGKTPLHYAYQERIPETSIRLLESYGAKGGRAIKPRGGCCPEQRSRKLTIFMCFFFGFALLAAGVTAFLLWQMNSQSTTVDSAQQLIAPNGTSSTSSSSSLGQPDNNYGGTEASASTGPPLVVVGVNPYPTTNFTTVSPAPTFAPNELSEENFTAPTQAPTISPIQTNPPTATVTDFSTEEPLLGATNVPTQVSSAAWDDDYLPGSFVLTTGTSSPYLDGLLESDGTFVPSVEMTDVSSTELSATLTPTGAPTLRGTTLSPTFHSAIQGTFAQTTENLVTEATSSLGPEEFALFQLLASVSSDQGAALNDAESPQYRAFQWLASNAFLTWYSDERKIQRYALATFYFSTGGENWANNDYWLSDEDECTLWFMRVVASSAVCNEQREIVNLDLDYNNVHMELPPELSLLSRLRRLDLEGGPDRFVRGTIPKDLGRLQELEALSFRGNEMTGTIPAEIGNCTALRTIQLSSNALSGSMPETLGLLTKLTVFSIERNAITGSIPTTLGNLAESMRTLSAAGNPISGKIAEIGKLSELRILDISMAKLTGQILVLEQLTNLNILNLSGNTLSGPLPELGKLTELETFLIRRNMLSSAIPSEIGLLTKLQGGLDLSYNQFSNSIPTELGMVGLLRTLYLQSNELTGSLPSELSQLSRLTVFRVEANEITGAVPFEVCDAFFNTYPSFYADCGMELECPCCTYCCVDGAGCTCEYAETVDEYLC